MVEKHQTLSFVWCFLFYMRGDNMLKTGNEKTIKDSNFEEKKNQKNELKWYLNQYFRAVTKKEQLELRLQTLRESMGAVKGVNYSLVTNGNTNRSRDGAASEVIRVREIEECVEKQRAKTNQAILNVMKIMDFLPMDSMERIILEYRHIDRLSWRQICRATNYSRTSATTYYNRGVDKLLTFGKVLQIIGEFSTGANL